MPGSQTDRPTRPEPTGTGAGLHPLRMVYGGGGLFGIAYGFGVAHGLADTGVPVATAPSLGTSAGSWVAAGVALGADFAAMTEHEPVRVPNTRSGVIAEHARLIFGEATHPLVSVSAVRLRRGRRHIFDGGQHPLADLIAASSAVPGLLPPHRVDGHLYVDGGMWSATSVDAAADAANVIVVAPLAGAGSGPVGLGAGLLLQRELRAWRARHPDRQITLIRPNRSITGLLGRSPLALFDAALIDEVYRLAREQGARWGDRLDVAPPSSPLLSA